MPMSDAQSRAWALHRQGLTHAEVGRELGISKEAARCLVRRARQWTDADQGVAAAADATGLDIRSMSHGWIKTGPDEHGTSYSGFFKNSGRPEDVAQTIIDALGAIPAAPAIPPPQHSNADLLTLYPLADVHLGMLAWGRETGTAQSTESQAERLVDWIGRAISASPPSKMAVLLDVGDFFHADDDDAVTPSSKHALDTDSRIFRTIEAGISAFCAAIEAAAKRHETVEVICLPGNHDPGTYMALLFALSERYRDNRRVRVKQQPGKWWIRQFGEVMLAAHHGDRITAQRAVNVLADDHARIWGATRWRYFWTGHLHHQKSQRIGGVQWEQLEAMTDRDAYAVGAAYTGRAQLSAVTYHRERGEVFRARVAA